MEPHIQYAKAKDGVSIAFSTMGEGIPLVQMPASFSHLQLEWRFPEYRTWYERLAERRKLVRYDPRGSGLSERDVTDFSLEARVLDLEAVIDRLGLEKFALFAGFTEGPVAITYAARHPERVSHLLLWCSWARAADAYRSPQAQSIVALREKDWKTYTEMVAHVLLGWSEGEPARRMAELMRESVTQETSRATLGAAMQFDVTALLPELRAATLVVQRRQLAFPDVDIARGLASRIPDARLLVIEGESVLPAVGDVDGLLTAIDEFLGEGEEARKDETTEPGAFRTVLFTDVEGSTALTQRLGDAKARELLRGHERIVRDALKSHGGSEVKTMGDGFMASFSSATKALECAIAMQRAFAARNESAEEPISVRIGLNAGEPIAEDDDLFGTAVNEAARITAAAKAGEILASDVVRQLVKGKDFLFADRGEASLKGFDEPVRLYEVCWREDGA
ncbi:MAG: adenylate/guanylate cyclase domain-containing protein [Dehalococcoidia bacterium]